MKFECIRCRDSKKSKLICICNDSWNYKVCNGCYGRLLSIYEIKSKEGETEFKTDLLFNEIQRRVSEDDVQREMRLMKIKSSYADYIDMKSLKFIATSKLVSSAITLDEDLDWSPAIIGVCKAVENEMVIRLFDKLKGQYIDDSEVNDKDYGKIAKYILGRIDKGPEIGTIGYFLKTVINSEERRKSSVLINNFMEKLRQFNYSTYILDSFGLSVDCDQLASKFRNRAAHADLLTKDDFIACREFVLGDAGMIFKLIKSTK